MVHGILQFTPSIAFRYVLHRCKSRDIRCRESFSYMKDCVRQHHPKNGRGRALFVQIFLGAFCAGVRCSTSRRSTSPGRAPCASAREGKKMEGEATGPRPAHPPREYIQVRGFSARQVFDNDPSAGSPTETLLRLLLPLNDKVQWTSRDVAGSEPPTSPRSEHFTGPFNR
jgi:hypothetical protein